VVCREVPNGLLRAAAERDLRVLRCREAGMPGRTEVAALVAFSAIHQQFRSLSTLSRIISRCTIPPRLRLGSKRRARQDFSFWDPVVFLSSIACGWERAYASFAAFLSTAATRRGTLPDPEQQPSPKLFL
jgi:hypothetical protein